MDCGVYRKQLVEGWVILYNDGDWSPEIGGIEYTYPEIYAREEAEQKAGELRKLGYKNVTVVETYDD